MKPSSMIPSIAALLFLTASVSAAPVNRVIAAPPRGVPLVAAPQRPQPVAVPRNRPGPQARGPRFGERPRVAFGHRPGRGGGVTALGAYPSVEGSFDSRAAVEPAEAPFAVPEGYRLVPALVPAERPSCIRPLLIELHRDVHRPLPKVTYGAPLPCQQGAAPAS